VLGLAKIVVFRFNEVYGTTPVNRSEQSTGMLANVADAQPAGCCSMPCNSRKRTKAGSWKPGYETIAPLVPDVARVDESL